MALLGEHPRFWGERDVEELLAERGVEVDHVSIYRWGRFTAGVGYRQQRHQDGTADWGDVCVRNPVRSLAHRL